MGIIGQCRKLGGQFVQFGALGVLRKATLRLSERAGSALAWEELKFPLRTEDIRTPATAGQTQQENPAEKNLRVGWVCMPPASGSGGHTTLFRMVAEMESRGHECTLLLYDRNSDEVSRHEEVIRRSWPGIRARVASATGNLDDFDAIVASSWATAHVIANRSTGPAERFYFIQDYEPYFYPKGYLYELAEATYRFGFHNIALGDMVAHELRSRTGIEPSIVVPFGCDKDVYRTLPRTENTPDRSGVVYYAKQSVDRRGYALAKATLERFHELCPDQQIHVIGDRVRGWKAPVTNHGSLPPANLNAIYNSTVAGLAMSFTNISLVPGELLAAGNIPVLNESADARRDLTAQHAVWAEPEPDALARKLAAIVSASAPEVARRAAAAAASSPAGWEKAQSAVANFIESQSQSSRAYDSEQELELLSPPERNYG